MYSFAQREDMTVLDEPFYGYYLQNASLEIEHPSQKEILQTMELNEEKVIENINSLRKQKNVFVKGMAHHYLTDSPNFILNWENVILIRHPKKLIASFSKVIHTPTLNDIGIKKASELFLFLKKNGKTPIVIDSDELLKNPRNYLKKLCNLLEIPFSEKMLRWKKGGIPEDGVWAKHWYKNVHNSEGFAVQKSSSQPLPNHLEPLLEEALPYYEILKSNILI
ncbi:MAG: sulfotransferase family protein [Aequorivita sp.]|nr:sulfotransferase family protein [Aequorivita sp.]